MEDEILVQKIQAGDEAAFITIIEKYQNRLWLYIQRISFFSPSESEEILQDIFIKIWKNIQDFQARSKFSTWAYSITRNHTFSCMQKEKKHRHNANLDDIADMISDPHSEELFESFNNQYTNKIIAEILLDLPSNFHEILILRYWEDKSYSEISQILQIPMGTVATLLNRAKKQFKTISQQKNLTKNLTP